MRLNPVADLEEGRLLLGVAPLSYLLMRRRSPRRFSAAHTPSTAACSSGQQESRAAWERDETKA